MNWSSVDWNRKKFLVLKGWLLKPEFEQGMRTVLDFFAQKFTLSPSPNLAWPLASPCESYMGLILQSDSKSCQWPKSIHSTEPHVYHVSASTLCYYIILSTTWLLDFPPNFTYFYNGCNWLITSFKDSWLLLRKCPDMMSRSTTWWEKNKFVDALFPYSIEKKKRKKKIIFLSANWLCSHVVWKLA